MFLRLTAPCVSRPARPCVVSPTRSGRLARPSPGHYPAHPVRRASPNTGLASGPVRSGIPAASPVFHTPITRASSGGPSVRPSMGPILFRPISSHQFLSTFHVSYPTSRLFLLPRLFFYCIPICTFPLYASSYSLFWSTSIWIHTSVTIPDDLTMPHHLSMPRCSWNKHHSSLCPVSRMWPWPLLPAYYDTYP